MFLILSGSQFQCYLKNTHEHLGTELHDSPPDFYFPIYCDQATDLIESKI